MSGGNKYISSQILTRAQEEIVEDYANGLIGKEIAQKRCMAYRTVVNHTQNAFDRAGLVSRTIHALVSWWYQTNWPEIGKQIGATILAITLSFEIAVYEPNPLRRVRENRRYARREFIIETQAA